MLIDPDQPAWRQYEDFVYQTLVRRYPAHIFERDIRVVGRNSQRRRQIDIAIRGEFTGHYLFVVVECKFHSRKVNVKAVESFIAFLADVGADIGIIVTNKGYSEAARKTAEASRIKLDIVDFDEIDEYEIEMDFCEDCDPGDDRPPGYLEWHQSGDLEGDVHRVKDVGRCTWCNGLHIRCAKCGTITGIPDAVYGERAECEGGCGSFFIVEYVYESHGMFHERLTYIDQEEQDLLFD